MIDNTNPKIATILPKGEGFFSSSFGAIALCVRDFTLSSIFLKHTIVIGGTTKEGFSGIDYYCTRKPKWYQNRTRYYARQCADYINNNNILLAEIHNRPHFLLLLKKKVRCKLALHLHNDPQEMKAAHTPEQREKLVLACKAVYCVSAYIKNRFIDGLKQEYHSKVHVVYNGLPTPDTVALKEKILLFVGRMTKDKGAYMLAQALRIALPKLPEWKSVFIGSRKHGFNSELSLYEKETLALLQPLGTQAGMPGFLSHQETLAWFARAEIAIIPSLWQEPFGRTALEAMAHRCAVISSGLGGLKEITQECAVTLAQMSAETLAEAIIMLANDTDKRKEFQNLGFQRAAFFNIVDMTKQLDSVRERII